MSDRHAEAAPASPAEGTAADLPLSGVRVLDLSRVFAGPMCGMVLGDFGAEVLKMEHPGRGDDTRNWGARIGAAESTYFNSMNRNKRSVTLDLQSAAGRKILRDLVPSCDVVLHNFKRSDVEKLGVTDQALRSLRPDLIYCAVAGYDSAGPEAGRPGYDLVIQAEAGLMALNGEAGAPPLKFGVALVDLMTGMYAAQAILAALLRRERRKIGQRIDVALYDCGLSISSYYALDALQQGADPERWGNTHPSIVPYGVYEASDGPLIIAVGTSAQFERFCCDVLQRADILQDARFASLAERVRHRETLAPLLQAAVRALPRATLLERMAAADVPCGQLAGLHEALTSPRTRRSGLLQKVMHPVAGALPVFAPPYRLDGQRLPVRHAPPLLGEGTRSVLQSLLSLSDSELEALRAQGVLSFPASDSVPRDAG